MAELTRVGAPRSSSAPRVGIRGNLISRIAVAALVAPPLLAPLSAQVGAQDAWRTDFGRHSVPLEEIVSGGPPRDGIPAIDRPVFVTPDQADRWLEDREPVMVVEHGGVARAYPYQIMIYHEIVNDRVGGLPVAVTYCPLCNTALAFERTLDGRVLDFGTTGRLRHSDLVMYDRQTESWWQQATGEAIVGTLMGKRLAPVPAQTVSWSQFRTAYPDGEVLSRETGHQRPYGTNPYRGYDTGEGPIRSFFRKTLDRRLAPMERVVAFSFGDRSYAYPFSLLRERRVVHDRPGGEPVVVFWAAGTSSALDAAAIAEGRDVGASGSFRPVVGGRELTFEPLAGARFQDRETGSMWDLAGRAVSGPMAGARLPLLAAGDYLWFAWSAFRPDTEVRP